MDDISSRWMQERAEEASWQIQEFLTEWEKTIFFKHEKELSFDKRYKKIFNICLIMVPERSTFHATDGMCDSNIQRNNFKGFFPRIHRNVDHQVWEAQQKLASISKMNINVVISFWTYKIMKTENLKLLKQKNCFKNTNAIS